MVSGIHVQKEYYVVEYGRSFALSLSCSHLLLSTIASPMVRACMRVCVSCVLRRKSCLSSSILPSLPHRVGPLYARLWTLHEDLTHRRERYFPDNCALYSITTAIFSFFNHIQPGTTSMSSTTKKGPELPPRFPELRSQILTLYVVLAIAVGAFVHLSYKDTFPVPEGKYFDKDLDAFINIEDYNPSTHGPYPRCHERHGFHKNPVSNEWVENSALNQSDPDVVFPVGHPENPEWKELRKEKIAKMDMLSFESLLPSVHLLCMSFLCVYLGAKHSVWLALKGEDGDTSSVESSVMQDEDAYWFPIMGSCVLFSLFVVYKYVNIDFIKFLFSCYIVLMCMIGMGNNVSQLLAVVRGKDFKVVFKVEALELEATKVDIICFFFSGIAGYHYLMDRNWIINNVFGISFCLMGIKMIGLSKYKTGAIMLCGLFVYDVFWVFGSKSVFGSNVMVTVAKGVEAPIKLMFPRGQDGCGDLQFSMLGLGDIVVPGLFIAFLAKFDATRLNGKSSTFLNVTMVSYVLSIVTTVLVMLVFNAAQPALLYIVPYILLSSAGTALFLGEWKQLTDFEIFDENEDAETAEDKKKK